MERWKISIASRPLVAWYSVTRFEKMRRSMVRRTMLESSTIKSLQLVPAGLTPVGQHDVELAELARLLAERISPPSLASASRTALIP